MTAGITLLRKRPYGSLDDDDDGPLVRSTTTAFLRKTAKGRVTKGALGLYSDLYSASIAPTLAETAGIDQSDTTHHHATTSSPVLSKSGRSPLRSGGVKKHYVILDTNVALHQMDLLESSSFGADVIVLQTVLEEVRNRSLPLYNRLNALISDESRRMWSFANEACLEAYVQRLENETPNDRNDRAIRAATKWYQRHLAAVKSKLEVVLLTDDAANRDLAIKDGLKSFTTRAYIEALPEEQSTNLIDLVAVGGELAEDTTTADDRKGKRKVEYDEYLPMPELLAGVQSGALVQGHFNPNPYNYLEGSVNAASLPKDVLLIGREDMNRAVSGDLVVVQLFPESKWKAPADEVMDAETTLRNDDPDSDEDAGDLDEEAKAQRRAQAEASRAAKRNAVELQPTGKVVGVIRRAWRAYVCHLDRTSLSPAAMDSLAPQNVFATPLDRKIPKIRLRTRQVKSLADQKFLVSIDRWDTTSRYPEGHFVRALGRVESKEAEIESLLLEWDVPYRPFSKAVLDCLPKEGDSWIVPPRSDSSPIWRGREDLRDLIICSIDPPGCQDIDDALHARRLPNGNIEAGVHIADVSHFVHADNPMDAEAASRGTTVYLVDKRIDMLPSLLGTNLCSLRPYVERLAFSVFWELDDDANIVNVRFTKSVIASKEAFTYEQAQVRKDDKSLNDELTQGIRLLNSIAIKLRAKRMAAGALNLASPEIKIHLDSAETTGPIDVEQKKSLETNSLVEEFMLLANISVARRIYERFPQTAVLRRHLAPPAARFEVLKDVLKKRKRVELDTSSSGALADSLDRCVDPSNPDFNTLVRIMATRCMLSAEYFSSGSVARDTFGHYGLASEIYTHFTSPIRRYADVLVHRELTAAITETPLQTALHSKNFVEKVMDNINRRHRSAQQAGRASVEFYVALALRGKNELATSKGQEIEVHDAFVIRTFRNGLAVFVSALGLEGLITFKSDFKHDPETYEVTIDGVKIGVFDKVRVAIAVEKDKQSQRRRVKMSLVEPVTSS